jgi:hypothetical protein
MNEEEELEELFGGLVEELVEGMIELEVTWRHWE